MIRQVQRKIITIDVEKHRGSPECGKFEFCWDWLIVKHSFEYYEDETLALSVVPTMSNQRIMEISAMV